MTLCHALLAHRRAWRIFNFVKLNQFMAARSLAFYLACLYTTLCLLLLCIGLSVWVGWCFQNNRFDYFWYGGRR